MFGCMDFQLCGLFNELNALASLPNEPRNVPWATGHLLGLLGATAQRRPTFLHRRMFALLGLRGHLEITPKSESPMQTAHKWNTAYPEHVGVWW